MPPSPPPIPGQPWVLEDLPPLGLAYLLATEPPREPVCLVCADDDQAERRVAELTALGVAARLFPGDAHPPFSESSPDPRVVAERLSVRHLLLTGEAPLVLVASAPALLGRWLPDEIFLSATELWVTGDTPGRERMARHLVRCGYQPVSLVEDEGTFALRGGIVDFFPPGRPQPLRADLFGDQLASLRTFDPATQRTGPALEGIAVHPLREVIFDDANVARALARLEELGESQLVPTRKLRRVREEIEQRNYFFGVEALWPAFYGASGAVLEAVGARYPGFILDDREQIAEQLTRREQEAAQERRRAEERHRLVLPLAEHLCSAAEVWAHLTARATLVSTRLALSDEPGRRPVALRQWTALRQEMAARRADASRGEILTPLLEVLDDQLAHRRHVFIAASTRGNAERLRELLRARGRDLPLEERPRPADWRAPRRSPRAAVVLAPLDEGLLDLDGGVALLCDAELLGSGGTRAAPRRRTSGEALATLRDLGEGDLVVHVDHGVGRYLGLRRLVLEGVDGDFVHLEYAGGDRLYVPVVRLQLLQRYRGPKEGVRLDRLGSNRWEKAKARVQDAVLALAHDLLAVQAKRQALAGLKLPAPDEQFRAFEATFPYVETADQRRAIEEVLADLRQDRPMDRLVCGDVGFGKTEVAVRAAFACVLGGRQAAILVPTTVLAEQHGVTFRERLQGQPVTVEVLSRFRGARETAALLDRLRGGGIDIVIGTHRLLSPDVSFKDLGLLVVDEEQRFGVKQKEQLKRLRSQVHVLTLSATPIPRTLHLTMAGLRDLSLIQTPPAERLSIRTEVVRFDEQVIAEAIRRELHRGGQVFVVHNRVRSIGAMAEVIRRLVPEARVAVAHGQMVAAELERIMVQFVHRECDVLVCTAIIESGIDIPSANTMIVNRADTFGLSQLYQLRGRIGRGRERAHAYLLLPRGDRLSREASERLAVLKRFSELGAGFQIASHDLDLRGAGDLLGAAQSGNIAAVGLELYLQLLGEAVARVRGQAAAQEVEPEIKVPVSAVLPEAYVPEPMTRLAFYQRFAQAESDAQVFDLLTEVEERYGPAPLEAQHFAELMVIRRRLRALGASHVTAHHGDGQLKVGLTFVTTPPVDGRRLALRVQGAPERYRLLPSGRLAIVLDLAEDAPGLALLRCLRDELGQLGQACLAGGAP